MTRPRAADDFAAIRARMEELRRERARVWAEKDSGSSVGPRPFHAASSRPGDQDDQGYRAPSAGRSSDRLKFSQGDTTTAERRRVP